MLICKIAGLDSNYCDILFMILPTTLISATMSWLVASHAVSHYTIQWWTIISKPLHSPMVAYCRLELLKQCIWKWHRHMAATLYACCVSLSCLWANLKHLSPSLSKYPSWHSVCLNRSCLMISKYDWNCKWRGRLLCFFIMEFALIITNGDYRIFSSV